MKYSKFWYQIYFLTLVISIVHVTPEEIKRKAFFLACGYRLVGNIRGFAKGWFALFLVNAGKKLIFAKLGVASWVRTLIFLFASKVPRARIVQSVTVRIRAFCIPISQILSDSPQSFRHILQVAMHCSMCEPNKKPKSLTETQTRNQVNSHTYLEVTFKSVNLLFR